LAYESGVTETVDPLAGSYYVETLTNEIEKKALEYIEKIDKLGGVTQAIEKDLSSRRFRIVLYQYQKDIEESKRIIVGC